jgi:hypothetical protein
MTGQRPDPEQVIRDWLADSAPKRAPASLRETLEESTSRPAGHARLWSGAAGRGFRWAGRVAAAAAILAVAISGAYLYGNGPAKRPGSSPSASAAAIVSPTNTPRATPSSASPRPLSTIVQLPGSSWRLVSGAFPQMVSPAWAPFQPTVFELTGGASVGFVAFVPSAAVVASHRPGDAILAAFTTAGPTAPTSWETRVYQSSDGVQWAERSALPSDTATVTAVAEFGGNIVAVGWTGETPNERATTWTTTDLESWRAAEPPIPAHSDTYSDVFGIAAGPSGLLAWGNAGTASMFWLSDDGVAWTALAWSGLPAEAPIDELFGLSDGWAIRGFLSDRAAMWHSNDGARWTLTWTGPGMSQQESYALGPIFKAPGGGFVSFGGVAMAPGGPAALPSDMLIWISSDELSWTKSARVKSPGWISGFSTGPGGYVAAGVLAPGDPGVLPWGTLGVWTSQDGRSWQAANAVPPVASIEVVSVVGDGAHVVVTCVDDQGNVSLLVGDGLQ